MLRALVVLLVAASVAAEESLRTGKVLISFPGAKWVENNDPIMGGQSHGNWSVLGDFGRFQGTVKNVSFLHAPGFCRAVTISPMMKDASAYAVGGLKLTVRTQTPNYKGFKLSFGTLGAPKHHGGHEIQGSFKTSFGVPASSGGEWQTVFLKFDKFSADWSDYTGECSTKDPDGYQHQCCSEDHLEVCPNEKRLRGINSFNIWAEGSEGDFQLDVKEIAAGEANNLIVV